MARRLWSNNARCKLGADIVTTGPLATVTLETGKGALFPSPTGGDWFILAIEDVSKNVEYLKITSRTGDICTVGDSGNDRAQEGSIARTFTAATSICGVRPTKAAFDEYTLHVAAAIAAHAASAISSTGGGGNVQAHLDSLGASIAALAADLTLKAPSGTRMFFQQTTAPGGWTKDTTHNDKALRVVSGSVTSGGATAFTSVFGSGKNTGSYALQIADMPAHNHPVSDTHTHSYSDGTPLVNQGLGPSLGSGGDRGGDISRTTGGTNGGSITTTNTGGGGGHQHSLSLDLQYLDAIVAQKD